MREAADQIRDEVARLARDVGLLGDRVRKLQTHFNQANEDIRQSIISVEKIEAHGERIQQVELGAELSARPVSANGNGLGGTVRRLEAGE
jgi:DNA recombination protein RmuC